METSRTPQAAVRSAPQQDATAMDRRRPGCATARVDDTRDQARTGTDGQAVLRLQSVGGARLDVAAIGAFTSDCRGSVADRLARLVSTTPRVLRVDCSGVISMDSDVAELFGEAATKLAAAGGELELFGLPVSAPSRREGRTS